MPSTEKKFTVFYELEEPVFEVLRKLAKHNGCTPNTVAYNILVAWLQEVSMKVEAGDADGQDTDKNAIA